MPAILLLAPIFLDDAASLSAGFQFRCLNDFHGVCKLGKTVMIYDIFSQGNLSKGIDNCSGVALFVCSGVTVAMF